LARNKNINNGSLFFLLITNIIDQMFFCVLLSKNVGEHFESWSTGILGPVALHGLDQGKWDLSGQRWTYQVAYPYFRNLSWFIFHVEKFTNMLLNRLAWKERPWILLLQMVSLMLRGCSQQ